MSDHAKRRLHEQRPEPTQGERFRYVAVLLLAVATAVLVVQALQAA
ncbi:MULTISPECIES: hypothetical protein [unclassified Aeromicrobium]|nr:MULTISPECIES: hypothetical protein [unclassified Aeromicrobium]